MTEKCDGPKAPAKSGAADSAVILLHGLGADGHDLFGLAPTIAQRLPNAAIYAPHAPFPCDMAPMGRQWFSMRDLSPETLEAGVRAAAPYIDRFMDEVMAEQGLAPERIALFGFSQGCMMSLHVAPRRAAAIAAVLGYSGALIGAERLAAEKRSAPFVLLVHGDADEVVPFGAHGAAGAQLEAAGLTVQLVVRSGLGHGIDPGGLEVGLDHLQRLLG